MAQRSNRSREELLAEVQALRARLKECNGELGVASSKRAKARAEVEQLRRAREAMGMANLIVETSRAVLFRRLADESRDLVYVSENLSMWGYSAADFLSGKTTFVDIVHPDDRQRVTREIEDHEERNRDEYTQEYRVVSAEGRVHWVSDRTTVFRDENGDPLYFQGMLVDITDRRQAEEALQASEYKFRKTIEGAAEGYLLLDEDLVIREVNDAYCRMLGYEREELTGRRPYDFATLEYQRFLETNTERFRSQDTRRFEGSMVHKDGHVVPVLVNANTLLDRNGGFLGHVAFVADLTEQQKALALAGEVQKSLLPSHAPRVPGLDVAGASVASEVAGGDYFDYLEDPDPERRRLTVAVGDISGHGVDAALIMTTARGFLRMRASQPGSPGEIVTAMNRHLADDLYGSGRFMTLFYVRFDPEQGRMQWVRAGHDPAVIYCPVRDAFTDLGRDAGLPLGVIRETSFHEEHGEMHPGQIIAIGTDGIWEARNRRGEMFGKDRFKATLRSNAAGTAREMLDAVFAAVHEHTGGAKLDDDVTLVVAKHGERG